MFIICWTLSPVLAWAPIQLEGKHAGHLGNSSPPHVSITRSRGRWCGQGSPGHPRRHQGSALPASRQEGMAPSRKLPTQTASCPDQLAALPHFPPSGQPQQQRCVRQQTGSVSSWRLCADRHCHDQHKAAARCGDQCSSCSPEDLCHQATNACVHRTCKAQALQGNFIP